MYITQLTVNQIFTECRQYEEKWTESAIYTQPTERNLLITKYGSRNQSHIGKQLKKKKMLGILVYIQINLVLRCRKDNCKL